ncbi:ribbon-helix-helix domain-containing protein [bacterium]|nr:ribbon-helix-helix domain-containing protein [bacterium]
MTMDESLIKEVDKIAKLSGKTRSAFTREALIKAIQDIKEEDLEKKQIEGYKKNPVKIGEFSDWESEQVWVN